MLFPFTVFEVHDLHVIERKLTATKEGQLNDTTSSNLIMLSILMNNFFNIVMKFMLLIFTMHGVSVQNTAWLDSEMARCKLIEEAFLLQCRRFPR